MDAAITTNFKRDIKNQLKNVRNAFENLIAVANRINVLHESHGLNTSYVKHTNVGIAYSNPEPLDSNVLESIVVGGGYSNLGMTTVLEFGIDNSVPSTFDFGATEVVQSVSDEDSPCSKDLHDSITSESVMGSMYPNTDLESGIDNSADSILNFGAAFATQFEQSVSDSGACWKVHNTMDAFEPEVGLMDNETIGWVFPGSTDDIIELDVVNVDITGPTVESNVNMNITESDESHEFVFRENSLETNIEAVENQELSPWNINIKPNQGCDDTNMFFPTSDSTTKLLVCTYCHRRFTKLSRHLETVHQSEAEVAKFCRLKPGAKERLQMISLINKRGQFEWNSDGTLNKGELITCRRPNKKFERTPADFAPCPKCLGSISEKTLAQHFKKCSNNALKGERCIKELSRKVAQRIHANACDDLSDIIFPKMRSNPSAKIIRFDWLIIEFGNDLCLNYQPIYQHKMIRTKIRYTGKLLIASKSIKPEITDFSSLFHVKYCNVVVEAVRKVSRFDSNTKRFGSPGTATTLVTLIKAVGDLLVIECMKIDDQVQEKNVERFLKVFTKDAKLKINKLAALTQANSKRRKTDDMPSTDDVNRLATYLDCQRDECFAELTQEYSYQKWQRLSELTLASVLVFNRRRTGEMRNIAVIEFEEREIIAEYRDKLAANVLPESISELIKSRLKIRGKLNRTVPVLLKHSHDECLQLLIRHRKDARISEQNEFLFALPTQSGQIKTVDSCAVMRTFSNLCAAENPDTLRGTNLRKHMATMVGTFGLKDNEVTNVANFMGHDDQIHRNVYRHNTLHREVVQMTSILEAVQGNSINSGHIKKNNKNRASRKRKIVANKSNRKPKGPIIKKRKIHRTAGKKVKASKINLTPEVFDSESSESESSGSELSDDDEEEVTNSKTNANPQKSRIKVVTNKKQPNPKVTEKFQKMKVNGKVPRKNVKTTTINQTPEESDSEESDSYSSQSESSESELSDSELSDDVDNSKTNASLQRNRTKVVTNKKPSKPKVTAKLQKTKVTGNRNKAVTNKKQAKASVPGKLPKSKVTGKLPVKHRKNSCVSFKL